MSLPKVIGPVYPNNDLSGIIYQIKNVYNIANPISNNIVVPSSSKITVGVIETMIMWNADCFQTFLVRGQNVYFQLEFPNRYIYPTAYSIRGVPSSYGRYYAAKWKVEGFNFGEEEDKNQWKLLAENTSSEGDYCGHNIVCDGKKIATFPIPKTNKGFRYIRFTPLESSGDDEYMHFTSSGIDIFGTLRTYSNLPCTYNICNAKSSSSFNLFVMICIFCSF